MDFNLIKRDLRKPILWFSSIVFSGIVIFTIVLASVFLEIKSKITYILQVNINFLLVFFVCTIINLSKTTISLFFNIEVITDVENNNSKTIRIIKSKYFYIFISLFVFATFFIEITSGSLINKISWIDNAKKVWWIFLIILFVNTVFIYLFFETTRYLLSQNEKFKKTYIKFINETKNK